MQLDPVLSSDQSWRTEEIIVGTWTSTLELGWVQLVFPRDTPAYLLPSRATEKNATATDGGVTYFVSLKKRQ